MIPHWVVSFLLNHCVQPMACILVFFAASFALIPLNDWYLLHQANLRDADIEELEDLLALRDNRTITFYSAHHGQPRRQ